MRANCLFVATTDPNAGKNRGRRHPSAGNLGSRPLLLLKQSAGHGRPSVGFPYGIEQQTDIVELGPDIDHASFQRLLSNVEGKRVLELGCANGAAAVALAKAGATRVISRI